MNRKEFLATLIGAGVTLFLVTFCCPDWRYWVGVDGDTVYLTLNPFMKKTRGLGKIRQQDGGDEIAHWAERIPSTIARHYPIPRWPMMKRVTNDESQIVNYRQMPLSLIALLDRELP